MENAFGQHCGNGKEAKIPSSQTLPRGGCFDVIYQFLWFAHYGTMA